MVLGFRARGLECQASGLEDIGSRYMPPIPNRRAQGSTVLGLPGQ